MNKEKISLTLETLFNLGFKSTRQSPEYNPMQSFTDYVSTKEIVHSKILADFLDPKGRHGMGRAFVDLILMQAGFKVSSFSEIEVYTEKYLRNGRWEGRRIDILVEDRTNKCALIIENKLNGATYQAMQLEDYRAAVEEDMQSKNVKVLCLHRDKTLSDNSIEWCDKVLYPESLSEIIERAVTDSKTGESHYILSYARYLSNLGKSNTDFENANLLASRLVNSDLIKAIKEIIEEEDSEELCMVGLSEEQKDAIEALKVAYQDLPNAYARQLIELVSQEKIKGADKSDEEAGYPYYAAIWNDGVYKRTKQWLSIGFSGNTVYFYMVSNQDDTSTPKRDERANQAGFNNPSYYARQGYYWYKPCNNKLHTMTFEDKPDFAEIINRIEELLTKLSEIN